MNAIAPKPTRYNGILFRSRLEARWALFFDRVGGVRWVYEPETFDLGKGHGSYLPDFYLERLGIYAEVKPESSSVEDIRKPCRFVAHVGGPLLLLSGSPSGNEIPCIVEARPDPNWPANAGPLVPFGRRIDFYLSLQAGSVVYAPKFGETVRHPDPCGPLAVKAIAVECRGYDFIGNRNTPEESRTAPGNWGAPRKRNWQR